MCARAQSLSVTISTPQDSVCSGLMATLTATVSGAIGTVSYQWYSYGTAISGATGNTYNFLVSTGETDFSCDVSTSTQILTASNGLAVIGIAPAQTPVVLVNNLNNEGSVKFCPGQVALAQLDEYGAASSYNWWIKPATAGTITLSTTGDSAYITMASSASDTIVVYASADGCSGTSGVDSVIRTFNPMVGPVSFSTYSDTACTGNFTYT